MPVKTEFPQVQRDIVGLPELDELLQFITEVLFILPEKLFPGRTGLKVDPQHTDGILTYPAPFHVAADRIGMAGSYGKTVVVAGGVGIRRGSRDFNGLPTTAALGQFYLPAPVLAPKIPSGKGGDFALADIAEVITVLIVLFNYKIAEIRGT